MGDQSVYRVYRDDELGKDGYPPVWHERLKHEVRAAAENRCVRCGHPYRNGEHGTGEWSLCDERCTHTDECRADPFPVMEHDTYRPIRFTDEYPTAGKWAYHMRVVEARWRILTVHHLDGNKANCRWWNLVALCQRCHLTIQGRVQMARVWPWEHSVWFRPYVAGYYAWTYLGEELSRAEAEARMDELLSLERVA